MLDSVKGYEDGYRFRALIEPAALRQPGYHLPAEAIERLRAQQRELLENDVRYTDAEIFEIGFNHFFRAPSEGYGGDLVYLQPHSAPGVYARAFLECRLTEDHLVHFLRETNGRGLSTYPHPW